MYKSLNINIERLNNTFETVFQLSEIENARKSLLALSSSVEEELAKKNVSDMVSSLIRALLKMSKGNTEEL